MSFDDPFFTDPDYMKKEHKKFDRQLKIVFIVMITISSLFFMTMFFTLNEASIQIKKQGGIGPSIGKFINSIQKEIK